MFPLNKMMKSSLLLSKSFAAAAVALIFGSCATFAQMPGSGTSMMNSGMLKLFGPHTAFACKTEIHVLDASQKETVVVPFGFTVWDAKMRMDIDMTQVKGSDIPPAMPTTLKELGMDQAVIIQRPDKKLVLNIYPRAKSYAETPMSKDEIAASEKTYTLEKAKIGKETVENHSCEKNNVTLTDEKGEKHVATVWNATDLKDFPVQIQMTEQGTTLLMKFRDVKLGKADASKFEAPGGLTKYKTAEALMDAATKGTLGGGAAK